MDKVCFDETFVCNEYFFWNNCLRWKLCSWRKKFVFVVNFVVDEDQFRSWRKPSFYYMKTCLLVKTWFLIKSRYLMKSWVLKKKKKKKLVFDDNNFAWMTNLSHTKTSFLSKNFVCRNNFVQRRSSFMENLVCKIKFRLQKEIVDKQNFVNEKKSRL